MNVRTTMLAAPALCALFAVPATGQTVQVTVRGIIEWNGVAALPLSSAGVGEAVELSFELDAGSFVDSPNFPTRGYAIDTGSFALATDTHAVGLQSPFPAGQTPYFVIRDNDPAVDGFFTSTNVDWPMGVPLGQAGVFGAFRNDFSVTYGGGTLPSLDILDALGSYDFSGLSSFNWTLQDGSFDAVGILFDGLTLEQLDGPWSDLGHALAGTHGAPALAGAGSLSGGTPVSLALTGALENATTDFVIGVGATLDLPFYGGTLVPAFEAPNGLFVTLLTDGTGGLALGGTWPAGLPAGLVVSFQHWIVDPGAPFGLAASNAVRGTTP